MRLSLPVTALAVLAGSLSAPAHAQQRVALPANTLGSGPAAAARTAAISAWTKVTNLPLEQSNGGFTLLNGKMYIYGGYGKTSPTAAADYTKQVQVYDLATNTWSMGADMPFRIAANGGLVKDGLLYNFGGAEIGTSPAQPSTSLVYNPATNTWATSSFPNAPSSSVGNTRGPFMREWIAPDGKIYMNQPYAGTDILNPVTNKWEASIAPPNIGRFTDSYTTAVVMDAAGLVHAFGGGEGSVGPNYYQQPTARHAVYNPATGLWTTAAPLPVAKLGASAVLGSDGNLYVLGGGRDSYATTTDVYIYNPTTDSWSMGPALPLALGIVPLVTQGNDIYFSTGTSIYKATVTAAGISWTGGVSSSWTDAGNWSGGAVPTASDDVTIPGGLTRYPSLSGSTPTARQLTLASGAQLSVADGGTLSLSGNFVNNGSFSAAGSGSVAFTGSTAQVLGGSATTVLQNLSVGTAGASLAGPVTVQRQLTLNGNLNTNAQRLVLASSSTGTALVVNSGGVVTGATTVQRYIDPAGNADFGYRHFSPAVSGATLASLSMGTTPQATTAPGPLRINNGYNSAADPSLVTPYPTVFAYNQNRVGTVAGPSGFTQGWQSPATEGQSLTAPFGFTINEPAGNFFELTGPTLNNGDIIRGDLNRSGEAEAGWQLLGNPYPSPIDWNRVGRTNVDAAAYVYRSLGRYDGGYTAYVNGVGTNILPQGQAFFVRVSTPNSTGTVSFTNSARETTYANPNYARPAQNETRPLVQLRLQRQGATGTASQDDFYVYEQNGASAGFDAEYDALKLQLNGATQPSLYQVVGTQSLAIQGLAAGSTARRLELGVNAAVAGTYSFTAEQVLNVPAAEPLWLEDKLTASWHNLRQGAYTVSLGQGLSTSRFVLHLHQATILASGKAAAWAGEVQLYPNPASSTAPVTVVASGVEGSQAELTLINSIGQAVWQQRWAVVGKELRSSVPVAGLAKGVYTLQVRSQAGVITRKLIVQ